MGRGGHIILGIWDSEFSFHNKNVSSLCVCVCGGGGGGVGGGAATITHTFSVSILSNLEKPCFPFLRFLTRVMSAAYYSVAA